MKRMIFTTAATFILTTNLIAGTMNFDKKDSTSTVFAFVADLNSLYGNNAGNKEFTSHKFNTGMADVLQNWVFSRESWEQEGSEADKGNILMEPVNLDEWVTSRESWEQESEEQGSEMIETVSLEEWIASRESWEQEGSNTEVTGTSLESDLLESWISSRNNWECK